MTPFVVESWIWYGFTISMVGLRMLARYLHFKSLMRLQVEDWFMLFIASLYTILIASLNVCAKTSSNLIDPHDIPYLTPDDISERIFGSKMILLVEQCMCAVQWGSKACLLMLYWRLTENLVQGRLVKGAAIFVGCTYAIMEILYFGVWCRPFHDYWQTPTDNVQCTTALHHLIVNLAFNLSTDLLIMSIPLPLLLRSHLEMKRKILLVFPFTLGFFSIICAILSKNLSFTQPFSAEWVYWYTREASTIMIVANMPYTWSLFRKFFHVHSFFGGSGANSRANSLVRVGTRDTGMEMIGGQIKEIRGLSLPNDVGMTGVEGQPGDSDVTTAPGRGKKGRSILDFITRNKRSEREVQRLPSTALSRAPATSGAVHGQWFEMGAEKKSINLKSKPISSNSSSAASDGRPSLAYATTDLRQITTRSDNDALNRLYPLDDDDLVTDIEQQRKRSNAREIP